MTNTSCVNPRGLTRLKVAFESSHNNLPVIAASRQCTVNNNKRIISNSNDVHTRTARRGYALNSSTKIHWKRTYKNFSVSSQKWRRCLSVFSAINLTNWVMPSTLYSTERSRLALTDVLEKKPVKSREVRTIYVNPCTPGPLTFRTQHQARRAQQGTCIEHTAGCDQTG
jgi:hypothetical protein